MSRPDRDPEPRARSWRKGADHSPVEALPLRISIHRALLAGTPVVVVGTDLGIAPGKKLAYVLNDERSGGQNGRAQDGHTAWRAKARSRS